MQAFAALYNIKYSQVEATNNCDISVQKESVRYGTELKVLFVIDIYALRIMTFCILNRVDRLEEKDKSIEELK